MADSLLMPKATAVWLIDNTGLTFQQIGSFCTLHVLEVQGIADGDVATGVKGVNPILSGQLKREEIAKAEADENYRMVLSNPKVIVSGTKKRGPRYTPISLRTERPNAIKWLVRNHPELKDAQIIRLIGTTKNTIATVRDGAHWNNAGLVMMDPVTLGLCTQINLDKEVLKANKGKTTPDGEEKGKTRLMSPQEALGSAVPELNVPGDPADPFAPSSSALSSSELAAFPGSNNKEEGDSDKEPDADSVFANLSAPKDDDDNN